MDLGLKSAMPIQIVNSKGEIELWDVKVRATKNPIGKMIVERDFANGGIYDEVIPVEGVFTFTRRSDNEVRILDAAAEGLPTLYFEIDDAPWMETMVIPPPNDNFLVTRIEGLTTNFIPGYSGSSGRVNICGENLILAHVRGLGTGWHGHVAASPSLSNFFPADPCTKTNLSFLDRIAGNIFKLVARLIYK